MALMAFSDSEVTNDKSCSKSCLQNYEALKKQYDDLLVKLDDTCFKASTYKRGLSILEGQILKYKESEVLFSEEIALLKRSVGHKEYLIGLLRTELEKVKEEKEVFEFKIAKFEKSSKDLDKLLASQITDKSTKGFGYNVVPSPHPLILNRPTSLDLSYSGLEEFKQPEENEYGPRDSSVKPTTVCDKESDNSKENTDDSLKQQQKTDSSFVKEEEPKKARENNDAPIIEDWVSDDEDDDEPIPKVKKKTVIPTDTKKEFVKPETPVRRSVSFDHIQYNCPNVHKHMVPRAVLMKTGLKTVNNERPVNTVRFANLLTQLLKPVIVESNDSELEALKFHTVASLRAFTSFFLQIFSSAVEGTVIFNVVDGPDSGAVTGNRYILTQVQEFKEFKSDEHTSKERLDKTVQASFFILMTLNHSSSSLGPHCLMMSVTSRFSIASSS
ncbi:hypothetical protein Tco_0823424 [Tanacetum coccineum]|uniref:Uncharacterized protein n=1 Tax=Tanacetum coccineum TaxID=301880 RepID=A0ABQ5AHU6_9ASTR